MIRNTIPGVDLVATVSTFASSGFTGEVTWPVSIAEVVLPESCFCCSLAASTSVASSSVFDFFC